MSFRPAKGMEATLEEAGREAAAAAELRPTYCESVGSNEGVACLTAGVAIDGAAGAEPEGAEEEEDVTSEAELVRLRVGSVCLGEPRKRSAAAAPSSKLDGRSSAEAEGSCRVSSLCADAASATLGVGAGRVAEEEAAVSSFCLSARFSCAAAAKAFLALSSCCTSNAQ